MPKASPNTMIGALVAILRSVFDGTRTVWHVLVATVEIRESGPQCHAVVDSGVVLVGFVHGHRVSLESESGRVSRVGVGPLWAHADSRHGVRYERRRGSGAGQSSSWCG